jgi:sec-independent protein translocase protein TatA
MFRTLGAPEIILIIVIILIFFGVGKLPQVGKAMGKGLRAFKRGQSGEEDEADVVEEVVAEEPPKKAVKKTTKKTSKKTDEI